MRKNNWIKNNYLLSRIYITHLCVMLLYQINSNTANTYSSSILSIKIIKKLSSLGGPYVEDMLDVNWVVSCLITYVLQSALMLYGIGTSSFWSSLLFMAITSVLICVSHLNSIYIYMYKLNIIWLIKLNETLNFELKFSLI